VQEPADQRGLAVVYTSGGRKPQKFLVEVLFKELREFSANLDVS
jgi:hypothetical protein